VRALGTSRMHRSTFWLFGTEEFQQLDTYQTFSSQLSETADVTRARKTIAFVTY
jgi:hypothetical protein